MYDPAQYVAAVKATLAEKSGLPVDQRRLIFTPCAQPSLQAVATAAQEHNAEDVLSELHGWQVHFETAPGAIMRTPLAGQQVAWRLKVHPLTRI